MLARIMDNQVWFEAYLRDTSGKGGSVRFAHHLHPGKAACDSGWRYWDHPVRLSQWLSQRRPSLQPRPCQCWFKQRSWRCTLWIPGRWAGPATAEVQWSVACDSQTIVITHCYILYYIIVSTSLLHIITFAITTHYYNSLLRIVTSLI